MQDKIIEVLRTVYDPEISINVYDLGLIYDIDIKKLPHVNILMTLTSAFCPYADALIEDVRENVAGVDGIDTCNVEVTFEPEFGPEMMSEEVRMVLGIYE